MSRGAERAVAHHCQALTGAYNEIAATLRELRESEAWAALHGNARAAALRRTQSALRKTSTACRRIADEEIAPLLRDGDGQP